MLLALAIGSDLTHIAAMLIWAVGLPLLLWHRWPRLSYAYTVYAIVFILLSQLSHFTLGECFLTTLSRRLWASAGEQVVGTFTVRLVNVVAGVRPSDESAVLLWEAGILVTSVAVLWSLYKSRRHPPHSGGALRHQH